MLHMQDNPHILCQSLARWCSQIRIRLGQLESCFPKFQLKKQRAKLNIILAL